MGYDSFGLPAEQYAIQTGQHPAITTKVNIEGGTDKQGNIIGYLTIQNDITKKKLTEKMKTEQVHYLMYLAMQIQEPLHQLLPFSRSRFSSQ